ncbi:alpha/beta fold hydrolase [Streptomyces misionensis]|uniref:alpha/beta fold hydrolase n=1 Tax=Streptomyces misionensis TaxID=67331 RepID=UPI00340DE9C0
MTSPAGPQSLKTRVRSAGAPSGSPTPSARDGVLPRLHQAGHRVYRPYLRGFGDTRFQDAGRLRSGQIGALGQDLSDFVEALDLRDVVIAGHDWGLAPDTSSARSCR